MDKQYILAIDHGTTSTRAILFDHECNMVDIVQKEGKVEYPKSGWVEQDALAVWLDILYVIAGIINKSGIKPDQVAAIGISNQRETSVLWDKKQDFRLEKRSFGNLDKQARSAIDGKKKDSKKWSARKPGFGSILTFLPPRSPGCSKTSKALEKKPKTAI